MRALLLVPVVVVIVAACGFAIIKTLGAPLALKEMMTAAFVSTTAGMLATIPLLLARHGNQADVVQASLFGTVIHLMVCAGAAGVVLIGKLNFGPSFVYWLFAFYLATLVAVAIAFAGAVARRTAGAKGLGMLMFTLLASADPLDHVLPHYMFPIGPIVVTNQMIMAVIAAVLMLITFPMLFKKPVADAPPRGATNFFESILEFLRIEVIRPALKEHTDRFVPYLWTLFFFILFCNLLGQLPISDLLTVLKGGTPSHFGGTATGSIATTGALAICTFLFIHFSGIWQVAKSLMDGTYGHHEHHEEHTSDGTPGHEAAHDLEHLRGEALPAEVPANFKAVGDPTKHYGDDQHVKHSHHTPDDGHLHHPHPAHGPGMSAGAAALMAVPLYFWNFAPHPFRTEGNPLMNVLDVFMWAFLLILELIGAMIKPFALMVRLFANMTAGHIVLAALVGLIPVTAGVLTQIGVGIPVTALSLLIRVLELFVAFLQAYIFTFLATLFIASAVAPEH